MCWLIDDGSGSGGGIGPRIGLLALQLNEVDSIQMISTVADIYIKNRTNMWWWEQLNQESIEIKYGDTNGMILLKEIVNDNNALVSLVVTDDDPEPWPVFQGKLGTIIGAIAEQRFFEYFIVANDYSWLIFDTHHNSLVVVGSLYEKGGTHFNY